MTTSEKVQAFIQGDVVLAELYGLSNGDLYQIAAQGKRFFEEGQEEKARKVFEGLTAPDPWDYSFPTGLGAVYQKAGELDRALLEYDRAVSLNQRDVAARTNRAEVLVEQGDFGRAVADLTAVAAPDPAGEQPHTRRAKALAMALASAAAAQPQAR